jgi:ABC-type glutathione transport system ATPase component
MTVQDSPLLVVDGISKQFEKARSGWRTWFGGGRRRMVRAVNQISFTVESGSVVGIVGESGSGKTTLGRMLLGLVEPTGGSIRLNGRELVGMRSDEVLVQVRPRLRMIFQHPDAVLNPGYTVRNALANAIRMHSNVQEAALGDRIAELLTRVGLDPSFADKYPNELSGGEKRRIGICRALATDPDLVIADEPLSGLDVLLQERILSVLQAEQRQRGFALLLISHDLDRVNQVCDRVLVMYAGHLMEDLPLGADGPPAHEQYRHPYSILLQQAVTFQETAGRVEAELEGVSAQEVSGAASIVEGGCPFRRACPRRIAKGNPSLCDTSVPPLVDIGSRHRVACHFAHEVPEQTQMSPVQIAHLDWRLAGAHPQDP